MTPLLLAATPLCGLLCATAVYTHCKLNVGFSGANVAALFVLPVIPSLTARLSAAGDEMSTDKKNVVCWKPRCENVESARRTPGVSGAHSSIGVAGYRKVCRRVGKNLEGISCSRLWLF